MSKYMDDLEKRIREAPPMTEEEAWVKLAEICRERERLDRESASIVVGLAPEGGGG